MKPYFFLILISLCGFTCFKPGDTKYALDIQNGSNHPVAFYVAALGMEHMYPDTALQGSKPAMRTIQPDQSASWDISLSFDKFFKELPTDTLSIYLFHPDTLAKYDWDVVRNEYKVLKRYDLSLGDLENTGFKVTYP